MKFSMRRIEGDLTNRETKLFVLIIVIQHFKMSSKFSQIYKSPTKLQFAAPNTQRQPENPKQLIYLPGPSSARLFVCLSVLCLFIRGRK